MANDWIKLRACLQSHPKVVRILSATCTDKFRVIGGLHAVWCVFDMHSEDGVLHGYTPKTLDHVIGWEGFSQALIDVGWLVDNSGFSLEIPEFSEHNGASGKRRAEDQKRKREGRRRPKSVRNLSAEDTDEKLTREEKRREDILNTSNLTVATTLQPEEPPSPGPMLSLVEPREVAKPARRPVPDCPHLAVLALWAEVLPAMPQHLPSQWRGTRADHLRARWRETAAEKGWATEADGLDYLRKFFLFVGESKFLTGRSRSIEGRRPFVAELEWLVTPSNWAKVHEGKYHGEAA